MLALAAVSPAAAVEYELFHQGSKIGVEYTEREEHGEGVRYASRSRFTLEGVQFVFRSDLELASDWNPLRYQLDALVDGEREVMGARRLDDRYVLWLEARGERYDKAFPARGKVVLLDNVVVQHYQVVLDRFAAAGASAASFNALVPQKLIRTPLVIRRRDGGDARLDGKEIRFDRFEFRSAGVTITVLRDPLSGELLEVSVPEQELRFLRAGFDRLPEDTATVP